ncbi:MAG: hypothetical protein KKG01_06990, partial [Candidatus Omnitrophica bacterium]|nr:hypothetical protein [Candidatus Omnitrophota bacterium]
KSHPWSNYIRWHSKVYDRRLLKLIDSRENFNLIDRIKLPSDYYANLYLYKIPKMKKGELSLKIFNGKIKIFYRDREITKDTGITLEFSYNNRTHGYSGAIWDFYNISPHQVKMAAEWPDPGIIQSTIITMDPEKKNTINVKVRLESPRDITLTSWYINSLISDRYKEWIRPFFKRVFKDISPLSNPNSFEALDLDYIGPNIVGIRENAREELPALLFKNSDAEMPMRAGVSNTNYYHNARCIYVTAASEIRLQAGMPKDVLDMNITVLDDSGLKKAISEIEEGMSK